MVVALVGLIFILLLVFVLIIRGQSKKYAKKTDSGEPAPTLPAGLGPPVSASLSQGRVEVSLPEVHLLPQVEQPGLPTQFPSPNGFQL